VPAETKLDYSAMDDMALAARVGARDPQAVRLLTQRYNQRLYRTAWTILRNRAEAEDAVQSAYLNAFAAIGTFEGRSRLSTWLTRITINEALGRARAAERRRATFDSASVTVIDDYREKMMRGSAAAANPDADVARAQIRAILERAISALSEPFRLVFVLREIEELSVEEAAEALGIEAVTVRTRHFRARQRLQQELAEELRPVLVDTFPFAGADCEAMTERVMTAYFKMV